MIILDTHVWWWAISEPERLSVKATDLIKDTAKRYVAAISLWEFAMMATKGRIDLAIPPYEWLRYSINEADTKVLPLSADIALDSCNLPGDFHKDPADRMIVATARVHHAQLVTKDGKIRAYSHVHSVW
jgi:PIN domain nuclease of toxin-antitoxin system